MAKRRHFISGHLDVTVDEFNAHYVPQMQAALDLGDAFVVGDARGTDTRAQEWLHKNGAKWVFVYHMFDTPRNNVGAFETYGRYATEDDRDAAMTLRSTHDIAWVRPGHQEPAVTKNIARRPMRSSATGMFVPGDLISIEDGDEFAYQSIKPSTFTRNEWVRDTQAGWIYLTHGSIGMIVGRVSMVSYTITSTAAGWLFTE